MSTSRRRRKTHRNSGVRKLETALFAVAAAGVIWLGVATAFDGIHSVFVPQHLVTAKLTVMPGETLWHLASRVGDSGEQQTDVVSDIRRLNPSLQTNSALSAGQTILVPVVGVDSQQSNLHLAKASDSAVSSM